MRFSSVLVIALSHLMGACTRPHMARGVVLDDSAAAPPGYQPPANPGALPAGDWREGTPESQGISSSGLAQAVESARARGLAIHELLVIRRGTVVLDAAFYPFEAGTRHDIASITKSVTSVAAGIATRERLLSPGTDVVRLLGGTGAPVTIEQALGMRSGLDCGFGRGETELQAMKRSSDWVRFTVALPRRSAPGTEFGYCSPNYQLVSAAIGRVAEMSLAEFSQRSLFAPLGIRAAWWPADDRGISHGWGDLQLAPRDLARIGLLMLHDGVWGGRRLLPEGWVGSTTAPRVKYGANSLYGLGWWSHPDSPKGLFEAIGRGGQRLTVWPDKELVVVMLGGGFDPGAPAPFPIGSLAADTALPPDPAGVARLERAVAAASAPPALDSARASPLSAAVSGTTWMVSRNSLGLEQARLDFEQSRASARLVLGDRRLQLPIGLRGRYEVAPDAIDGIRPGTRGRWSSDSTFVLELDLIGKIDHYTLTFRFQAKDQASIDIVERTGLMRETLSAKAMR